MKIMKEEPTVKAIVINQYGSKDVLEEKEVEKPAIGDDQVLVENHATSINPIDWKLREGYLKQMLDFEFPIILGWDVAGTISEIGQNVSGYSVGDRVFARPETTNQGTYAEYVPVDAHLLAPMPDSMTYEEAAAIPLAGLTAWQCLVDFGEIKKGDNVLIHAGAGGVGSYAIQIAKSFGAHVATTASGKNEQFVRSLGADEFINYREQDFSELLSDYDLVVDTMGGKVQEDSFKVLKKGGKLVSIADQPSEGYATDFTTKFLWLEPNGEQLKKLADLFEKGELKPVIGETFDLSEQGLKDAHALSETHHAKGKIIIKVK